LLNIDQREFAPLLKEFPQGIVAIDLETTGLSPLVDKVIEVAAIKVEPAGVNTWSKLINPKVEIPAFTIDIHGITQDMVADSPVLSEVLPDFLDFVGDMPLVAHNARFDVGFLVFAQHQQKIKLRKNNVFCSVKASRKAFPQMKNHKLGTLAKALNLGLENHHRALDDSLACLRLFNKAMEQENKKRVLKDSLLFNIEGFKKNKQLDLPDKLKVLIKRVEKQILVDIKYKGGSHKGKFRPIKPISLLPMPEGNILYALCLLSNLHKSFALNKIQEVKELNAEEISKRFKDLDKVVKNT
jgi:DNA polymerase-3 subunit epsilon